MYYYNIQARSIMKGGRYLEDKYEVIRLIAGTEHSKVYLVKHKQLEVYRVAKVVSKENADCERALKEANIIKHFKHPGIPLVYDIEVSGDSICIIEEYIAGKSLSEYIACQQLSTEQVASMGISICEVLEFLHDYVDVVHMDLKPANIIVRNQSVCSHNFFKSKKFHYDICIIDFDSSSYKQETVRESFGTVGYAAPEQYRAGERNILVESDIYSMGMILLYMLSGGHVQSMAEATEYPWELHSDRIGAIIRRCLRHSPNQRFKSIKELKEALGDVARGRFRKSKKNNICAVRDIYVYGTGPGVGTTHFSLCLAAFLHRYYRNSKVLYKRVGDREDILAETVKGKLTEQGTYKRHGIYIMPDYGGGISCDESGYDYVVHDYGVERPVIALDEQDDAVCICVDVRGYRKDIAEGKKCLSDITFVNHISGREFYHMVNNLENVKRYYRIPCIYQWEESNRLFEEAVIEALGLAKQKAKRAK